MNLHSLTIAFVLLCLVGTGLAIDCHQCASKDGPGCIDYYDPIEGEENIDGCEDTDTHCLKIKIISKLQDSGAILGELKRSHTVTRGCEMEKGSGDYCEAISSSQGVMLRCICRKDGCNGATGLGASLTLLLLTVAAVLGAGQIL